MYRLAPIAPVLDIVGNVGYRTLAHARRTHCDRGHTKHIDRGRIAQRRFPPPWSVEELDACFVVRDRNGQALVNFENEPGRRSPAKLLSKDEARRIAVNIAKRSC